MGASCVFVLWGVGVGSGSQREGPHGGVLGVPGRGGGGVKRSALQRKSPLKPSPETVREFQQRARRNSRPKGRAVSPASRAQRIKVKDRLCANCGNLGPCDPAHLTPRAHGGCDSDLCVIPLCRTCHRNFDEEFGERRYVDLEALLALPEFAAERAHMAEHLSLRKCIERLTGRRLVDGERIAA